MVWKPVIKISSKRCFLAEHVIFEHSGFEYSQKFVLAFRSSEIRDAIRLSSLSSRKCQALFSTDFDELEVYRVSQTSATILHCTVQTSSWQLTVMHKLPYPGKIFASSRFYSIFILEKLEIWMWRQQKTVRTPRRKNPGLVLRELQKNVQVLRLDKDSWNNLFLSAGQVLCWA